MRRFIAGSFTAGLLFLWGCGGGGGGGDPVPPPPSPAPTAPTISVQPQAASIDDGAAATFAVVAQGTPPLRYQWQRGTTLIEGATSATYTTPPQALADSGSAFSVVVSNSAGLVSSAQAALTVRPVAPSIVAPPQAVTVTDGGRATFSVEVRGSAPLSYQWRRNAVPIPGATAVTHSFDARLADSGAQFGVVVSNGAGTISSAVAVLSVNPAAPGFVRHPPSTTAGAGSNPTFEVTVNGSAPFSYEWERSDDRGATWKRVEGAATQFLTVANATFADFDARFRVRVTNAAATVVSDAATLTVIPDIRVVTGSIGGWGLMDGPRPDNRIGNTYSIAAGGAAGMLFADEAVIRRVDPTGTIETYVGRGRQRGYIDATGADARFFTPYGLAMDAVGNVYTADMATIRRISPAKQVTTIAGLYAHFGYDDGTGPQARFGNGYTTLALDAAGNLYAAEQNSHTIRKITPAGVVTTLAGAGGQAGSADGPGPDARFNYPFGIVVDPSGNVFVADSGNHTIRKIRPDGMVSTFAGTAGQAGLANHVGPSSRFANPMGVALDPSGNLYVADSGNRVVRRIEPDGTTTTLAGSNTSLPEYVDGIGPLARFNSVTAIAYVPERNYLLVADGAFTLRTVTLNGATTTLAGRVAEAGSTDGFVGLARLNYPEKIAIDATGNIYVADRLNYTIRRISPTGTVSTFAGQAGSRGTVDGPVASARFDQPSGIALDAAGNLYVSEEGNHTIRKIAGGVVTTIAGAVGQRGSADGAGADARFSEPRALAVDQAGNVFVADLRNNTIRRISPTGNVTTLAGSAGNAGAVDGTGSEARFGLPIGLAVDAQGNVYVADNVTHAVRKITPAGVVTTIAGALSSPGSSDGPAAEARFLYLADVAVDSRGYVYIADGGNGLIRRLSPSGRVDTIIGQRGSWGVRLGAAGTINAVRAIAVNPAGRLVFVSEQAVISD